MATPGIEAQDLPSGSFVSVKHDGFEVSSNTGTADDIRAELGIAEPTTDGAAPKEPVADLVPTRARRPNEDPRIRKQSIQAQIDTDTARRETARKEADAEEARLVTLREESKKLTATPRQAAAAPHAAQPQAAQPAKVKDYDGTDPDDPEPTIEQFATTADPYTARNDARMDWAARKETRKLMHRQQEQGQQQQADQTYRQRTSALGDKIKAHESVDKDFRTKIDPDVASELRWSTPQAIGTPLGDLVMDAPNSIELMLHFSQHKQEFQRIAALHPFMQAIEFGKVVARLERQAEIVPPKPKPVSKASAPIKPLGGTPTAPVDDDRPDEELSDSEHDARWGKLRKQYR